MKKIMTACLLISSFSLVTDGYCSAPAASPQTAPAPATPPKQEIARDVPVTVHLSATPSPFIAEDKKYLVYEVFLTNFKKNTIELTNLAIGGKNSAKPIATFDEAALTTMMAPIGVAYSPDDATIILPGMQKIVYIWLPLETDADIPKELSHTFTVQPMNDDARNISFSPGLMTTNTNDPVIVGVPLLGDNWIAGNGPSNTSEHRRAYRVGDGKVYYSQRFAIDFVRIGLDGLTYKGDKTKNSSYYSYQSDVYSVAPGRVVDIMDHVPENVPNSGITAVAIDIKNMAGNYIMVDLGDNKYALYAHLIPGSLKVKPGDSVAKGQVLAQLGNSGNSSEPHLHLQITDAPSILFANGLPYGFNEFSIRPGQYIDGPTIQVKIIGDVYTNYKNQLMVENSVVKFPDKLTVEKQDDDNSQSDDSQDDKQTDNDNDSQN
jgi:hypothetical protein